MFKQFSRPPFRTSIAPLPAIRPNKPLPVLIPKTAPAPSLTFLVQDTSTRHPYRKQIKYLTECFNDPTMNRFVVSTIDTLIHENLLPFFNLVDFIPILRATKRIKTTHSPFMASLEHQIIARNLFLVTSDVHIILILLLLVQSKHISLPLFDAGLATYKGTATSDVDKLYMALRRGRWNVDVGGILGRLEEIRGSGKIKRRDDGFGIA